MSDLDLALFELLEPAPPRPAAVKEPRLGAINTKWTKYSGVHKPCDLCVKVIHEQGVASAPPPRSAAWKRVGPNDTLLLCSVDAEEQRRKDKEAEKVHKERVAASGERTTARQPARKHREGLS